ncbi:hypothetical protein DFH28DRAFT_289974 [Melampsora americana]|nr:hypothetical protein DFH28DRAFT_289974 [Melampsora americana]
MILLGLDPTDPTESNFIFVFSFSPSQFRSSIQLISSLHFLFQSFNRPPPLLLHYHLFAPTDPTESISIFHLLGKSISTFLSFYLLSFHLIVSILIHLCSLFVLIYLVQFCFFLFCFVLFDRFTSQIRSIFNTSTSISLFLIRSDRFKFVFSSFR